MKSILLLFILFVCTSLVSAQEEIIEYSVYFDVPKDNKFRAKNSYDITITSTLRFINGEKMKWELFYNATENKPRAINFICPESIPIEEFSTYLEQITKGDFWELVAECLAGNVVDASFCINELAAFEKLACLIYTGENCNK